MLKTLVLMLLALCVIACTDDTIPLTSQQDSVNSGAEQDKRVSIHGRLYLGAMQPLTVNLQVDGRNVDSSPVDQDGKFSLVIGANALNTSNVVIAAQGYVQQRPIVMHQRFTGNRQLASRVASQNYQMQYQEFPQIYISPVSEAYYQLPSHADGDWLLHYAAAVKLYADASLVADDINLMALAQSSQAMTDFVIQHSEAGFQSPMAQAIADIERDPQFALNLRDERLYGEFFSANAVPKLFARNNLVSSLTITPEQVAAPGIKINSDSELAHSHKAASWNRVGNRIFIEDMPLRQEPVLARLPHGHPAFDALLAKTGDTVYPAVESYYVNEITVLSVQDDELLVRLQAQIITSAFSFEWEGELFEVGAKSEPSSSRAQRWWRAESYSDQRYTFDIEDNSVWLLPDVKQTAFNPAVRFYADGSFERIDLNAAPPEVGQSLGDDVLQQVFMSGVWSLLEDNKLLRLEAQDSQAQVWVQDIHLTRYSDLAYEALVRVYAQGEPYALHVGGAAALLSDSQTLNPGEFFAQIDEPYLLSLNQQTSAWWQSSQLRSHAYDGWWLFNNQRGARPTVTCLVNEENALGYCAEEDLSVTANERLDWSLNENNGINIDRFQDEPDTCGLSVPVDECSVQHMIMPINADTSGNFQVIEWQILQQGATQTRTLGPRLSYYHVIEAPLLFERPSYADEPEPEPEPEPDDNPYSGVTQFNVKIDLDTSFASADVSIWLNDQNVTVALSELGALDEVIPLSFEAEAQKQVLVVDVWPMDKPFALRQITSDYAIVDDVNGERTLQFNLRPNVVTTAHAALVELTLTALPTNSRELLLANFAIPGLGLNQLAQLLLHWYETPEIEWQVPYTSLNEIIDDYQTFQSVYLSLDSFTRQTLEDTLFESAGLTVDLLTGEQLVAGQRSSWIESTGFGGFSSNHHDVTALAGDQLSILARGYDNRLNYTSVDYTLTSSGNVILPTNSENSVFQNDLVLGEITDFDWIDTSLSDVLTAWFEKHAGDNPKFEFERQHSLDIYLAIADYGNAIAHYFVERQLDLPFSFEHESIIYETEQTEETYLKKQGITLDLESNLDTNTHIDTLLGESMLFLEWSEQGLSDEMQQYSFLAPNSLIVTRSDGSQVFGSWSLDDNGKELSIQREDADGTLRLRSFLPELGLVRVDYWLDDELVSRLPASFIRIDGEVPYGLSAVSAAELLAELTNGQLLADLTRGRANMFWGRELLAYGHSLSMFGVGTDNAMLEFAPHCDGFVYQVDDEPCTGDYGYSPISDGISQPQIQDDSIVFVDELDREVRLTPIGAANGRLIFLQQREELGGEIEIVLHYGMLVEANP